MISFLSILFACCLLCNNSDIYTTYFDSEGDYRHVVITSVNINLSAIQGYISPSGKIQLTYNCVAMPFTASNLSFYVYVS